MATPKTSSRRITARQREVEALKLRKSGMAYRAIGAKMGVTASAAYKAVSRGLARITKQSSEQAEELQSIELERLDDMHAGIWTKAKKGDSAAIDRVLRIQERRAKLLGLDAPTKSEIELKSHDAAIAELDAAADEEDSEPEADE